MLKIIVIVIGFLVTGFSLTQPNILLIIVDDLRPALGAYGEPNAHTPNIDILARKSIVYKKAYTQQALCAPSRNSFLTSRKPDTLHLYDFYSYWRNTVGNFTTLPQYFKSHGYTTYSVGKIFHPGISSNNTDDYPYSWSYPPYHPSTEKYKEWPVCPDSQGYHRNLVCPVEIEFQPEKTLPDIQITSEAIRIIKEEENSVRPYFLSVGFHKPHIPLKFPKKYLDFHPIDNITIDYNTDIPHGLPTVAWNPWTDIRSRSDIANLKLEFPYGRMSNDWIKKIVQSYHAAVTYVDDLLGKLLEEINDNTIVVLIGDHGWSLGEHGEWSKYSNFDISTRVPFIIFAPGTKPKVVNSPVQLLDLFPTLVDLAKLPTLPKCISKENTCTEGESLLSSRPKPKYAFSQFPRPGVYPTAKPNSDKPRLNEIQIMGYTVFGDNYRYTEWVKFNHTTFEKDWSKVYGAELYSHEFDPGENINLVGKDEIKDVIQEMQVILRNYNK